MYTERMDAEDVDEELPPAKKKQKLEETASSVSEVSCSEISVAAGGEGYSTESGPSQHLMETDVGITEYISPQHPGFFAILKQRWLTTAQPPFILKYILSVVTCIDTHPALFQIL